MTTHPFSLDKVDDSWKPVIHQALSHVDPAYLNHLASSTDWLPGPAAIFNAFSQPLNNVHYVLFGESPYPRRASANGYAFWDNAITDLWSDTGLSKPVNRATSMRNIIKMLLVADGLLDGNNTSQSAIAKLDKTRLISTNQAFFQNLLQHGFLLLNATPVLQAGPPQKDAKAWRPFTHTILQELIKKRPEVSFLLFGKIAQDIDQMIDSNRVRRLCAEHPYNISFINNIDVQSLLKPLRLLHSR